MKKLLVFMLLILTVTLVGCTTTNPQNNVLSREEDLGKITIVATIFPQYDFARQIGGERASVTMLLPPGGDSHSFEPKPSDILAINKADLFIYTGEYMEFWAGDIINSIPPENGVHILDVTKNVTLVKSSDEDSDDHSDHDDHGHEEHGHEYDPHIWTNPIYAKVMVENISKSMVEIDPDNGEYYKKNTEELLAELDALDARFREIVSKGKRKDMYFGGRFVVFYFTREYGLVPISAYSSVSSESEPSVADVAHMMTGIEESGIPVVYYEELTSPRIAQTISEETGAEMLLFHGLHNVSKKDFQAGITYIDIMKQNAANLEKGLG